MWANAAGENRGPVIEQVLRRDSRGDVGSAASDEVGRFTSGDVFNHNFERWKVARDLL